MRRFKLILYVVLFLFCSDLYLLPASQENSLSTEATIISNVFSRFIKEELKEPPLKLFPLSSMDYLKSLNKLLKDEYFVLPKVAKIELTPFKEYKGKYKIVKGGFSEVVIFFDPFLIKGLKWKEASYHFKDLFLDMNLLKKGKLKILSCRKAYLDLRMDVKTLSDFIRKEAAKNGIIIPPISSPQKGILKLIGDMKFLDYQGKVNVEGYPWVDEKNYLRFKITKCVTDSGTVPGFIVETISHIVNPLFYLERFLFELQTEKIDIEKGEIILRAKSLKYWPRKKLKIEFKNKSLLKYLNKGE